MKTFKDFIEEQEQPRPSYYITAREVLYRRYGEEVANDMIRKVRERGRSPELEKKYFLPDYSDESIDRVIPVVIQNLNGKAGGYYDYNRGVIGVHSDKGVLDKADPDKDAALSELRGGKASTGRSAPYDVVGHEAIHAIQPFEKGSGFDRLRVEIAPVMGEIKRWYFQETGIALGADMTDADLHVFIKYMDTFNLWKNVPYGDEIDFRKILHSEDGKEAFRLIVKGNTTPKAIA
jgi:hypothetical protein